MVAASAICLARVTLGVRPYWTPQLQVALTLTLRLRLPLPSASACPYPPPPPHCPYPPPPPPLPQPTHTHTLTLTLTPQLAPRTAPLTTHTTYCVTYCDLLQALSAYPASAMARTPTPTPTRARARARTRARTPTRPCPRTTPLPCARASSSCTRCTGRPRRPRCAPYSTSTPRPTCSPSRASPRPRRCHSCSIPPPKARPASTVSCRGGGLSYGGCLGEVLRNGVPTRPATESLVEARYNLVAPTNTLDRRASCGKRARPVCYGAGAHTTLRKKRTVYVLMGLYRGSGYYGDSGCGHPRRERVCFIFVKRACPGGGGASPPLHTSDITPSPVTAPQCRDRDTPQSTHADTHHTLDTAVRFWSIEMGQCSGHHPGNIVKVG